MKSTKLNVNSWHYKLASNFGYDPDFKDHDICAYTRRVVLGLVLSAFIFVLSVGVVYLISTVVVNMVLGPIFYFMYGVIPDPSCFIGWILVASGIVLSLFMLGTAYFRDLYDARRAARKERKLLNAEDPDYSPDFLSRAYAAYKNKFCMRLEFTDEHGNKYETERQRIHREERERYAEYAKEMERLAREARAADAPTTTGSAP